MEQILSPQNILECMNTYYGIRANQLTLVLGGADLNATTYKADAGHSSYFVKAICGPYNEIGLAILELLSVTGIEQVIPPLKTNQGRVLHNIGNFSLIVFPFVDGKNGFDCSLSDLQWRSLGKALRRIHELEIPPELQSLIRREDYSPQWRKTVRSLYSQSRDELSADEIALKTAQFFMDRKTTILGLLDQAERLCQEAQRASVPSVLCHSDIHAGNILMSRNKEIYIVDWDNPILAPKERDLMFIGGGVAGVWNQPHEEELFFSGYGHVEVNTTILAYYRHERIIEDIGVYVQELAFGKSGNPGRELMFKHFTSMFEPGNVVEIAFKTWETTQVK